MDKAAWTLQLVGLIVVGLAVVLNLAGSGGTWTMLIRAAAGVAAFLLGRALSRRAPWPS